jgi:putative ABC transport system substrate-binding protein
VERPARFELVVNLKTAKSLGLAIPRSALHLADRVIQ